jgi:radical SAM protein with 4Fe4S-binding SPASM domain
LEEDEEVALKILGKILKAIKALVTRRVEIDLDRIVYVYEDVPLRKLINWILVEASIYFKPERPWGYPTHLQIEPADVCNLSCSGCPAAGGSGRRGSGRMDFAIFKKLIDEVGDYVFLILLWDWGEPFLNNSIYEMIAYARKKGIKVASSTNGNVITTPELADKLVRSGLDSIIIALDGMTIETYGRYRKGGDIERVKRCVRLIVERKRALNSAVPLINLRNVVMRHNEHEAPFLKELASELGADALTLKTMNPYCGGKTADNEEFIPKNPRYRRFEYTQSGERVRVKKNPCKHLWNNPAVHADGSVCVCTFDASAKHAVGDLNAESFKDIWRGERMRGFRRAFAADWENIDICKECSYAYRGGNCSIETIAEAVFFEQKSTSI